MYLIILVWYFQVALWKKYIDWEKSNPMRSEDAIYVSKRGNQLTCIFYLSPIYFVYLIRLIGCVLKCLKISFIIHKAVFSLILNIAYFCESSLVSCF